MPSRATEHARRIANRVRSVLIDSTVEPRSWVLDTGMHVGHDHLILLVAGEALLLEDLTVRPHPAPALIWWPANHAETLTLTAGTRGFLLSLRRDLTEEIIRQTPESGELQHILTTQRPLVMSMDQQAEQAIGNSMRLISAELFTPAAGAETIISAALTQCLVLFWRQLGTAGFSQADSSGTAALLVRFRQIVEERFRDHWPIAAYARALGISVDRLHATCTRVLGRSPRVLVQQRLTHEAIVWLERSAMSVKQLAFVLGFKDAAYFSRFFLKQTGLPPGRYRREITELSRTGRSAKESFTFADWP